MTDKESYEFLQLKDTLETEVYFFINSCTFCWLTTRNEILQQRDSQKSQILSCLTLEIFASGGRRSRRSGNPANFAEPEFDQLRQNSGSAISMQDMQYE